MIILQPFLEVNAIGFLKIEELMRSDAFDKMHAVKT